MSGAVALPLITAGPPGWMLLGVLTVVTTGAIILAASQKADDELSASESTPEQACPDAPASPEQIADEATPDPDNPITRTGTRQVRKPGGQTAADKDFDRMKPVKEWVTPEGVRVGQLPDGRMANVRPHSSADTPTLEIQKGGGHPPIKIRYDP